MADVAKEILRMLKLRDDRDWIRFQVLEDLRVDPPEKVLLRLKEGRMGWRHPRYASFFQDEKEADDHACMPMEAEEGVLTCRRCQSRKIAATSVQTRASDEPLTTMAQCTECRFKWTQN